MSLRAVRDRTSQATDCPAACLCGDDERDPCPWCQEQHAGTDRRYREASADVAHEYYKGLAEVVGEGD